MGLPTTPQEAAPAYDDVFHDHPVNQFQPTGSASGYATVPQDDVELQSHHDHTSSSPDPAQPETLIQTLAGVFRPTPHVHCEQCDVQTMARERRENQKHCCAMVAATFMVGFVCLMLLGIIVTSTVAKRNRHGHN
ncbi:hypothetical protein K505DRAFT_248587 [Melanomma pulvis-pyrius CBS 109.77]|uniref:Uncharacterized protein n=1 Tax=Melanomma pulvis-pyrius CBS 109.77 TaxID=1314802 RepID=A0A6A6X5L4_9PLEO|nr:hypothetical protein K505DRAFT_248587 [Melanomma pulvis-pyrius CBS 109.77]